MIFGKKNRKDPTSPANSKKSLTAVQTSNKSFRKAGSTSSAPAVGGSPTGDESLLGNLSPTSYAQQFDALDQVVAAATTSDSAKNHNNHRAGSLPHNNPHHHHHQQQQQQRSVATTTTPPPSTPITKCSTR